MSSEVIAILGVGIGLVALIIGWAVLMVALFAWSERRQQERHERLEARYDRLEAWYDRMEAYFNTAV